MRTPTGKRLALRAGRCGCRRGPRCTADGFYNGGVQGIQYISFVQHGRCSRIHHGSESCVRYPGCEPYYRRARSLELDRLRRLHAAYRRQIEVDDDDRGLEFNALEDGILTILRVTDYADVRVPLQNVTQQLLHDGIVVNQQNSNHANLSEA